MAECAALRQDNASLHQESISLRQDRSSSSSISTLGPGGGKTEVSALRGDVSTLRHEVGALRREGDHKQGRLEALENGYEAVLVEMVGFQRGMAQQDGLMQSLISSFLGVDGGGGGGANSGSGSGSMGLLGRLGE